MWKWIVGAAMALVVLLIGTCWYGYHRLTAGGDVASVAIAAPPARVFASLADPDSMSIWMEAGSRVTASHHGELVAGDTVHVERTMPGRIRAEQYTWRVTDIKPDQLLVLEMRNDSLGRAVATRRDSLVASGDSTVIYSTIATPMIDSLIDSLRTTRGDTSRRVPGALLKMSSKMLVSAFRIMSEQEFHRLKARIEGKPMPAQ